MRFVKDSLLMGTDSARISSFIPWIAFWHLKAVHLVEKMILS